MIQRDKLFNVSSYASQFRNFQHQISASAQICSQLFPATAAAWRQHVAEVLSAIRIFFAVLASPKFGWILCSTRNIFPPHKSHLLFAATLPGGFLFLSCDAMAPSRWFHFPSPTLYDTTEKCFFDAAARACRVIEAARLSTFWHPKNGEREHSIHPYDPESGEFFSLG